MSPGGGGVEGNEEEERGEGGGVVTDEDVDVSRHMEQDCRRCRRQKDGRIGLANRALLWLLCRRIRRVECAS